MQMCFKCLEQIKHCCFLTRSLQKFHLGVRDHRANEIIAYQPGYAGTEAV